MTPLESKEVELTIADVTFDMVVEKIEALEQITNCDFDFEAFGDLRDEALSDLKSEIESLKEEEATRQDREDTADYHHDCR